MRKIIQYRYYWNMDTEIRRQLGERLAPVSFDDVDKLYEEPEKGE